MNFIPPKLTIFLLCSFAITLVPCRRKANVSLYCIELKQNSLLNQKQTCLHLPFRHRCEAKGVIVYNCAPDWLREKKSQPSMAIMTVYRAVFCVLPLENLLTGLCKMATKSNTNFSCISIRVLVNQHKLRFFRKKTLNSSLSLVLLNSFLLNDSLKCQKTWQTLSKQGDEILQHSAP